MTTEALETSGPPAVSTSFRSARSERVMSVLLPVLSVVAALALWELISRTELISQRDLPAMSTAFQELWSLMKTREFWADYLETIRGWAIGITLATALAVPIGIVLGSSDVLGSAFRVPIEFLRPICRLR